VKWTNARLDFSSCTCAVMSGSAGCTAGHTCLQFHVKGYWWRRVSRQRGRSFPDAPPCAPILLGYAPSSAPKSFGTDCLGTGRHALPRVLVMFMRSRDSGVEIVPALYGARMWRHVRGSTEPGARCQPTSRLHSSAIPRWLRKMCASPLMACHLPTGDSRGRIIDDSPRGG
jgi:hypothetical protein